MSSGRSSRDKTIPGLARAGDLSHAGIATQALPVFNVAHSPAPGVSAP